MRLIAYKTCRPSRQGKSKLSQEEECQYFSFLVSLHWVGNELVDPTDATIEISTQEV
jgi:hypothetical protein